MSPEQAQSQTSTSVTKDWQILEGAELYRFVAPPLKDWQTELDSPNSHVLKIIGEASALNACLLRSGYSTPDLDSLIDNAIIKGQESRKSNNIPMYQRETIELLARIRKAEVQALKEEKLDPQTLIQGRSLLHHQYIKALLAEQQRGKNPAENQEIKEFVGDLEFYPSVFLSALANHAFYD